MLPDFFARRFIVRKESVRPNQARNWLINFFSDDTTLKRIAAAVITDGHEVSKTSQDVSHIKQPFCYDVNKHIPPHNMLTILKLCYFSLNWHR